MALKNLLLSYNIFPFSAREITTYCVFPFNLNGKYTIDSMCILIRHLLQFSGSYPFPDFSYRIQS